jgi:hypothetical protein
MYTSKAKLNELEAALLRTLGLAFCLALDVLFGIQKRSHAAT